MSLVKKQNANSIIYPTDSEEAASVVKSCLGDKSKLWIGGNSSRLVPTHGSSEKTISSNELNKIHSYSPEELNISVGSGVLINDLTSLVNNSNQLLPFEPRNLQKLIGLNSKYSTAGGELAMGIAGPRRIQRGGLRDSVLGVEFINGTGEIIHSGGVVAKNVTGLNLSNLQCGAYGSLGFLTKINFRTIAKSPSQSTLLYSVSSPSEALEIMQKAKMSAFSVSGSAYLPSTIFAKSNINSTNIKSMLHDINKQSTSLNDGGVVALRIEGFEEGVSYRKSGLIKLISPKTPTLELNDTSIAEFWQHITDVSGLIYENSTDPLSSVLWVVKTNSGRMANVISKFNEFSPGSHTPRWQLDWAGSLLWLRWCKKDGETNTNNAVISTASETIEFGKKLRLIAEKIKADVAWQPCYSQENDEIIDTINQHLPMIHPKGGVTAKISTAIRSKIDPDKVFNSGIDFS